MLSLHPMAIRITLLDEDTKKFVPFRESALKGSSPPSMELRVQPCPAVQARLRAGEEEEEEEEEEEQQQPAPPPGEHEYPPSPYFETDDAHEYPRK